MRTSWKSLLFRPAVWVAFCAVLLPVMASAQIRVVAGTYGGNCKQPRGNRTSQLAAACNGRSECTYKVDYKVIGDPAIGCAKDYVAEWQCGSDAAIRKAIASPEAGYGSPVTLSCASTPTSPASPPPPAPSPSPTAVRYRMENLIYAQPDRYTNPRNWHDFMVDFVNCTVREMNQESAQGREQTRISVCRPNKRLTFTTITDGNTVEYDWAFRENGRVVGGAWRQGGSFGPSVGAVYGTDIGWETR